MSLPQFDVQGSLFESLGAIAPELSGDNDRYKLVAQKVWPVLASCREELLECYDSENGRPGVEPVVLLGVLILSDAKLNATGRDFCQIWCGCAFHIICDYKSRRSDPIFELSSSVAFQDLVISASTASDYRASSIHSLLQPDWLRKQNTAKIGANTSVEGADPLEFRQASALDRSIAARSCLDRVFQRDLHPG